MMTLEKIDLKVCTDCLMIIANDDASGMDTDTETLVREGIAEWSKDGYVLVPGDDTDSFSWARCDVCNSHLGGERHEVVALSR